MRYREILFNEVIDIGKNQWKEVLINENITFDSNKILVKRIYNKIDYMATAKELTEEEGKYGSSYNSPVVAWAKRIIKYFNIEAPRSFDDSSEFSYWHVLFLGAKEIETGNFLWILRDELREAIDELIDEDIWDNNIITSSCEMPEEISIEEVINEGARKVITVNSYERNKRAVNICIQHYKALNNGRVCCQVCNFDFASFYGENFKNKIHVHHKIPISELQREYRINPVEDLVPVCPNCHMVIHSRNPVYTIEELKNILNQN